MKRALRRHHNERLKKRAICIGKDIWCINNYWTYWWLSENYNTLQQCNRICCRNPRRSLGQITKQEKIADYDFKEQMREWRKRSWLRER